MTRRELIDSYVAAWNALDPERVAGHFAGNGGPRRSPSRSGRS